MRGQAPSFIIIGVNIEYMIHIKTEQPERAIFFSKCFCDAQNYFVAQC